MTTRNKQRRDKLIKTLKETKQLEKRIKNGLIESNAVLISKKDFKTLPNKVQELLNKAPKFEKRYFTYLIDFEPEVVGISSGAVGREWKRMEDILDEMRNPVIAKKGKEIERFKSQMEAADRLQVSLPTLRKCLSGTSNFLLERGVVVYYE